jgi:CubicO group peptidase (beta-lactamase class C family)
VTELAARLGALPERLAEGLRAHHVPGASLAVLAGEQVFATAAGVLNARTGVEATPDSIFQMGSITKPWTATLVMQLVEEGRLRLADRVADVLPGFTLRDAAAARRITVEQLLTHTSGIDGDQFLELGRGSEAVARFVEAARDFALVHPPGAGWSYCNAGFVLAGRIVEVLRGAPYDTVLRERLIRPLGLAATGTLAEEAILHRAAAGHFVDLASGATQRRPGLGAPALEHARRRDALHDRAGAAGLRAPAPRRGPGGRRAAARGGDRRRHAAASRRAAARLAGRRLGPRLDAARGGGRLRVRAQRRDAGPARVAARGPSRRRGAGAAQQRR